MKKSILTALIFVFIVLFSPEIALADDPPGGDGVGSAFGTIEPPVGVDKYELSAGGGGMIGFFSKLITVFTIIAGLWVLYNFIRAGFTLLSSGGDSSAYGKVSSHLTMSVVGLVLIVAAYAIVGVISQLLFGKADFLLSPEITGPGQ